MMTATFKAYQGADQDKLIDKLIDCKDWSHIGHLRASNEMNHVEVDVYFKRHTKRAALAVRRPLMAGWFLQSIS